jgi:hypothetical protein
LLPLALLSAQRWSQWGIRRLHSDAFAIKQNIMQGNIMQGNEIQGYEIQGNAY